MNEHYKDKYIKYKNKYYNFKNKNKKKLKGGNIFIYGGISIIIILISSIFYIEKLRIDESKKKLTLEQSSEQVTVSEPVTEPITQPVTEPITQPVTEPITQQVTEPITQKVTEPITQKVTEPITQKVTEPITPLVNDSNSLLNPKEIQSENDLYNIKSLDLASISLNDKFNDKPQEEPIQAQSQKTYSTMYFTTTGTDENKKEKQAVAPPENTQNIDNVESTENNTVLNKPSGLSNSETKPVAAAGQAAEEEAAHNKAQADEAQEAATIFRENASLGVATLAPADVTPAPTEGESTTVAPAPQTEAPTTSPTAFLTAMTTSAVTDSPTTVVSNTEEVAGDEVEPVVNKSVQDSGNNTVTPTEERWSLGEGVEMSLRTSPAEVASDQAADVHAPSTNAAEEAARLAAEEEAARQAAAMKIQSLVLRKQGRRKAQEAAEEEAARLAAEEEAARVAVVQMGKPSGYYFAKGDHVKAQIMRKEEKRLEKLEEEKRLEKLEKEREEKNKQRNTELIRVKEEIKKRKSLHNPDLRYRMDIEKAKSNFSKREEKKNENNPLLWEFSLRQYPSKEKKKEIRI